MPVSLYLDRSVLDGPSPDLKEAKHTSIIMLKFDIIASSLDGVSQIISSQLVSPFKPDQAVRQRLEDGHMAWKRGAVETMCALVQHLTPTV